MCVPGQCPHVSIQFVLANTEYLQSTVQFEALSRQPVMKYKNFCVDKRYTVLLYS